MRISRVPRLGRTVVLTPAAFQHAGVEVAEDLVLGEVGGADGQSAAAAAAAAAGAARPRGR